MLRATREQIMPVSLCVCVCVINVCTTGKLLAIAKVSVDVCVQITLIRCTYMFGLHSSAMSLCAEISLHDRVHVSFSSG